MIGTQKVGIGSRVRKPSQLGAGSPVFWMVSSILSVGRVVEQVVCSWCTQSLNVGDGEVVPGNFHPPVMFINL